MGKRSKRKPSTNTPTETTPTSPNNAHQGEPPNSPGIIAPNVREEAQLMDPEPIGMGIHTWNMIMDATVDKIIKF